MRVAIIVNPVAGHGGRSGRGAGRARTARDFLRARGLEPDVSVTQAAGHATRLAREACARGVSLVYAWGGDGTVNEVASALAFSGMPLAIVPAGSGNGLANTLGVSHDPARALADGLVGQERTIDVGELDGRRFVNVAGIGLDARVADLFDARRAATRGFLVYLGLSLRELLRYEPETYEVTLGDRTERFTALIVALANSPEYGNGARIAPGARVDDGQLDLVVVEARSWILNLWRAPRLFTGTVARAPGVRTWRIDHVRIAASRPVRFHVDGEPAAGGATLEGRIHARALRVRVPAG